MTPPPHPPLSWPCPEAQHWPHGHAHTWGPQALPGCSVWAQGEALTSFWVCSFLSQEWEESLKRPHGY